MLFNQTIFGPIHSRRLGSSLGVNLLPANGKICTFNCLYCECGFNFNNPNSRIPTCEEVELRLEQKLKTMAEHGESLDTITFSGNGEPTMHPNFNYIIDKTIELRNRYFPSAKVSVLSNATMIWKKEVFEALLKVDNNILKLDSATEASVRIINQPTNSSFSIKKTIENLKKFNGNLIIQTLFFKGKFEKKEFDNTTPDEVSNWLDALLEIKPKQIMIYSLDRATPAKKLTKADAKTLHAIAKKAEDLGFKTLVTE